jgi:hypothetical protein
LTSHDVRRPSTGEAARIAIFYIAFIALLILITTKHLADLLPHHLAKQVSDNSEGYTLALVACAWLQFVRPAIRRRAISFPVGLVGGAVCLGLGLICKNVDSLPGSVRTLNEAFFALAFLLVYVSLPRPMPYAPIFSVLLVVGLLIAHDTSIVLKGAEAWVVLVLAPLSFDVFDRAILEPGVRESHVLRLIWMAVLVLIPIIAVALHHHLGHGHVAGIRDYISKANEAFVGLLIIHAYCGYWARSALAGRA